MRERAMGFVQRDGSKAEAARVFGIQPADAIQLAWCEGVTAEALWSAALKLDKEVLLVHVRAYPDALLQERAAHFGVRINALWVALKQLDIRKKKRRVTLK